MSINTKVGFGLALLATNMCLLLLVLNILGWMNLLHADLTPLENFAENTLSRWEMHFQAATVGWLVLTLVTNVFPAKSSESEIKKNTQSRRPWHRTALVMAGVVATLALPHILVHHRHRHPIIRRSVLSQNTVTFGSTEPENVSTKDKPAAVEQELVFSVDNMTCGGCGSHVRNVAESNLAVQQRSPPIPFTVNKVQVDWRAGVMSIYGTDLKDSVDRSAIALSLAEEGYPTTFLYSQ